MVTVQEIDGRKWSDNANGGSVSRRFRIKGLAVGFSPAWTYTGLPNVGDAHPTLTGYKVATREFEEGQGKDKTTVTVTVNYAPETSETSGSGQDQRTCVVDDWGWNEGTDEKELTSGIDGTPVLNSAGDPFESAPTVSAPAPTFTKVMKFKSRQSGWGDVMCCVNQSAVTIGGISFPAGSLLCTVLEKRIIGSKDWKYQYTVNLKYKSNMVKLNGSDTLTDIGWDVAVSDSGMRELDENGKKVLIKMKDKETGKMCNVTSPALLDGQGKKVGDDEDAEPYNFRFQAYARANFPSWFYSEPTAQEEGLT